jgi:hypothetical protein
MTEWEMPVVKAAFAEAERTGVSMAEALDSMMADGRVAVEFVERPGNKNSEGVRFRVTNVRSDSVESRPAEDGNDGASKSVRSCKRNRK